MVEKPSVGPSNERGHSDKAAMKNPIYSYAVGPRGEPLLVTQSPDDRVMIFIDLGGLSKSLEDRLQPGRRIDWFRLAKHLAGPRRLTGAVIIDRAPGGEPGNPKQRFHDHLRYSGFRVLARGQRPEEGSIQGELNVALTCELLGAAARDQYDVAVIATLDRALVPAMEALSREGKFVEVAGVSGELGPSLRRVADRVHHIDDLPVLEILPTTNGHPGGDRHETVDGDDEDDADVEAELPVAPARAAGPESDMPFAREVRS